jgi:hypothetical protein
MYSKQRFYVQNCKKKSSFYNVRLKSCTFAGEKEPQEVKGVNGVKEVKDKCLTIVDISIRVMSDGNKRLFAGEAFVFNFFNSINFFNFRI